MTTVEDGRTVGPENRGKKRGKCAENRAGLFDFDTKMFVVSLKKMVMCHVDIDTQAAILLPGKF